MKRFYSIFRDRIYEQIIKPIILSVSPIDEIALGVGIGMFVGFTPTVGLQMWIVFLIWLVSKYFLKLRFDLVVGTALVWISNPLTMFPMYYAFLATGIFVFSLLNLESIDLEYEVFYHRLHDIISNSDFSSLDIIIESGKFFIVDLGLPMFVGSFVYAIPLSIGSYFLTQRMLLRYRMKKAKKMGISYEAWKQKFEKKKLKETAKL